MSNPANPAVISAGRNFCPNPVNPVPAGFENSKSGALLEHMEPIVPGEPID